MTNFRHKQNQKNKNKSKLKSKLKHKISSLYSLKKDILNLYENANTVEEKEVYQKLYDKVIEDIKILKYQKSKL